MKYCPHKVFEYNRNGINITSNFVTFLDIKEFHGKEFADQWLMFVRTSNLDKSIFGKEEGYYYIDYQFYAQRTKMWLES